MENITKKLKVLAVDDNKAMLMIIKEHLSSKFELAIASSPDEAMNWMKKQGFPDIIILDKNMDEDLDAGLKFLKIIRASGFFGTIPVLILSGTDDSESSDTRIMFLKAGADDFLLKPFNPTELEWKIIAIFRIAGKLPYNMQ